MILTSQKRYWITPDFAGNLDLPEAERVEVEIIRATVENRNRLTSTETKRSADGEISMHTNFHIGEILRNCVGEIKNLEVQTEIDGKTEIKAIKSGKELAGAVAYGLDGLVSIICTEVARDTMSLAEKKILK